jgi:hypothetical protein
MILEIQRGLFILFLLPDKILGSLYGTMTSMKQNDSFAWLTPAIIFDPRRY